MTKRTEVEFIDKTNKNYLFEVAPNQSGGKLIHVDSKDWEPGDVTTQWRTALHPWKAGLGPDRISSVVTFGGDLANRPSMVYAKSSGDASNENYFTAPPKVNQLRGNDILRTFFNSSVESRYAEPRYAYGTYAGGSLLNAPLNFFVAVQNFNGNAYFGGGQYLYKIGSGLTFTLVKDFGSGKQIYAITPFNNELVIAMGETVKIWTMDTTETFTQATDAVYAIALTVVESRLWRACETNKLSNCITAPRTLTSWVPSAGSEYTAGNSTYSVTALYEYRGECVAVKPDGVLFPDSTTKFRNQAPQLETYPHLENGRGTFKAYGYLFVPSVAGVLQISLGQSIVVGPELSLRPDYRFWVRAGVEWGGNLYLLCTDESGQSETAIFKVMRDFAGDTKNPYIYHEWCRLGDTESGHLIIVYTQSTNPVLVMGHDTGLDYIIMGRGSGPDVEDPNYILAEEYELETGLLIPQSDLGVEFDLVGVKIVGKQPSGASITAYHDINDEGTYRKFLSTQDGGGIGAINDTGFFSTKRYAEPNNATGNILQLKLVGTLPANTTGPNGPRLREFWAYGNAHPSTTDIITMNIYSSRGSRVRGLFQGRSSGEILRQLSRWRNTSEILQVKLPEYSPSEKVRVQIIEVTEDSIESLDEGGKQVNTDLVKVVMRRVNYTGDLDG